MLLSIPLTMSVKIALETGEKTHWAAVLLGGQPVEPPASPPGRRLLIRPFPHGGYRPALPEAVVVKSFVFPWFMCYFMSILKVGERCP
jgi:hypothetical protein